MRGSQPTPGPRAVNALHELRSEAAGLIRSHLWQDGVPDSPDAKPWTMNRDLSIWNRLVESGYQPEDVNGAISVCRMLTRRTGPMRLTCFYWKSDDGVFNATPFLERCIGLYHKNDTDTSTHDGLRRAQFQEYLDRRLYKHGVKFNDYGVSDTVLPENQKRDAHLSDGQEKPGSAGEQPGRSYQGQHGGGTTVPGT